MNCPRCNQHVAFTKNQCDACGQDLRTYRKMVSLSNIEYNQALSQAQVRDLSGAMQSLRKSLQFNKLNTSARNLLGLIYYEEGEIVAAISEWVLSKHYQEKGNDADEYIQKLQADPNRLEMYNQSIKKYNTALFAAKHGDTDMAIIQLKKVVNMNPNFVRANQLLALLYMMTGRRDNRARAFRLMRNMIKIDVTNTTTLRYLKELSDMNNKSDPAVKQERAERLEKEKARQMTMTTPELDMQRPITPYKEEKPSIMPIINILIGIIIGIVGMYFLVIPHIKSSMATSNNAKFKQYSEKQASKDSDVATLKDEKSKLEDQIKEYQDQIDELKGKKSGKSATFREVLENLSDAIYYLQHKKERVRSAEALAKINEEALPNDSAKKVYAKVKEATYDKTSAYYSQKGQDAFNGKGLYKGRKEYDEAEQYLKKALEFNPGNVESLYYLGRVYQQHSDNEKAKECYQKIVEEHASSDRVKDAKKRLRELGA